MVIESAKDPASPASTTVNTPTTAVQNNQWLSSRVAGGMVGGISGNASYEQFRSSNVVQAYVESIKARNPNMRMFPGLASAAFRAAYVGGGAYIGSATGI
jgi:hypothetical protein